MANRVKRRRRERRGVKVLDLPGRGLVCRWTDPIDGRLRQQAMAPLGITARVQAEQWAAAKSKTVLATRAKVAAEGVLAVRVPCVEARDTYISRFKESTAKGKRQPLADLVAALHAVGCRDMASIAPPMLSRWKDSLLANRRYKASTVNRWLAVALAWINWARDQGMTPELDGDRASKALKRVSEKRDAIVFLQPQELRVLLEAALRHDVMHTDALPVAGMILMTTLTGMRASEVFGLRWDEIDWQAPAIRLPAARVKTDTARAIDLSVSPSAVDLLHALALRRRGACVFPGWTDAKTGWVGRWQNARKRLMALSAPEHATMQTLRRTTGTVLANAAGLGLTTWGVAKRMGHGVQIAEAHYVGALSGLPADARTFEAAVSIENEARRIIEASGGVVRETGAETG